jgi:hypothetical protein
LATQSGNADGLIQAATATLTFGDVFTDGGLVWNGSLHVDFVAPNEPYTAFDYDELSTTALVTPEPSTIVSASLAGLMGLCYSWRLRKAKPAA